MPAAQRTDRHSTMNSVVNSAVWQAKTRATAPRRALEQPARTKPKPTSTHGNLLPPAFRYVRFLTVNHAFKPAARHPGRFFSGVSPYKKTWKLTMSTLYSFKKTRANFDRNIGSKRLCRTSLSGYRKQENVFFINYHGCSSSLSAGRLLPLCG
jgi:hypothetical protein